MRFNLKAQVHLKNNFPFQLRFKVLKFLGLSLNKQIINEKRVIYNVMFFSKELTCRVRDHVVLLQKGSKKYFYKNGHTLSEKKTKKKL